MIHLTIGNLADPGPWNRADVTGNRTVELTLNLDMEDVFKEIFEIEMLQSGREVLPNGQVYYRMDVEPEKAIRFKEWIMNTWISEQGRKNATN